MKDNLKPDAPFILVLQKSFKMTPRRREILWHIAYTDEIQLRLEKDYARYRHACRQKRYVPILHGINCSYVISVLTSHKLISVKPSFSMSKSMMWGSPGSSVPPECMPKITITLRGMEALLECAKGV